MKTFLSMLLLACCSLFTNAQQLNTFTSKQLHQDLDSLVAYLEEVHPDLYSKYPRQKFYAQVAQLKRKIKRTTNILEFYTIAAPLLGKLEDGHIDFKIKEIYDSTNHFVLPHRFKLTPQAPYIQYQESIGGMTAGLPAKANIIQINGIPARQIVQDVISMVTGENEEFRANYGASRLDMFLELLYHCQGTYAIEYMQNGKLSRSVLKGIRKQDLDKQIQNQAKPLTQENCYRFHFEGDSTVIMKIKCLDWTGLKTFLDSSFTQIQQRHVKNLIIDLTDNGGGESEVGDAFLNYLFDHPYKQYDKVLSKNSRFVKQRLLNQLKGKIPDADQKVFLAKKEGTIDTIFVGQTNPTRNLPLRYRGRLYVLVNKQTYSSAADFAQCIKYYKRGLIIGEETGGMIKSFGDIVPFTLPNSKLKTVVSSKLYYNVGAQDDQWGGVIPDMVVSKQTALTVALQEIEDIGSKKAR